MSRLRGLRPSRIPDGIDPADWKSWQWQMQNRIRSPRELAKYVTAIPDEIAAIEELSQHFHFVITPYYASLMNPDDPACPLRRQVVPRSIEAQDTALLEQGCPPLRWISTWVGDDAQPPVTARLASRVSRASWVSRASRAVLWTTPA